MLLNINRTPKSQRLAGLRDYQKTARCLRLRQRRRPLRRQQAYLRIDRFSHSGAPRSRQTQHANFPHQLGSARTKFLRDSGRGYIWHSQGSGKSLTMVWLAKWISNNVRRVINRKHDQNPEEYERLSERLTRLLKELKENKKAYKEALLELIEMARDINNGSKDYPEDIDTEGKRAIYDNVGEDLELTNRILNCIASHAQGGWRNLPSRQKMLTLEIKKLSLPENIDFRMDTHDFTWTIQMMKTQWGSCTQTTRTIRMNLLLARVPIECIDYVVVHEMCHLQERLHNKVFEALMTKYMPTWRKSRTQLNEFVGLPLSDFS